MLLPLSSITHHQAPRRVSNNLHETAEFLSVAAAEEKDYGDDLLLLTASEPGAVLGMADLVSRATYQASNRGAMPDLKDELVVYLLNDVFGWLAALFVDSSMCLDISPQILVHTWEA